MILVQLPPCHPTQAVCYMRIYGASHTSASHVNKLLTCRKRSLQGRQTSPASIDASNVHHDDLDWATATTAFPPPTEVQSWTQSGEAACSQTSSDQHPRCCLECTSAGLHVQGPQNCLAKGIRKQTVRKLIPQEPGIGTPPHAAPSLNALLCGGAMWQ